MTCASAAGLNKTFSPSRPLDGHRLTLPPCRAQTTSRVRASRPQDDDSNLNPEPRPYAHPSLTTLRRLRRPKHQDKGHPQQPHPQGVLFPHPRFQLPISPMRLGSPSRACALRSRPRTGRRALDSRSSRSRARCAQLGTLEPHSCPRSCPHMLTAASRCSQVVEWDEVKFDVRLMQRVPCTQLRVNPSLATATPSCCSPVCLLMRRRGRVAHADLAAAQAPRSRRAPVRRRGHWNRSLQPFPPATCSRPIPPRCSGLALIIESDFVRSRPPQTPTHDARLTLVPLARAQYATDAGRAHFADQLTSIRYCVQEVSGPVLTFLPRPAPLSHRTRSRSSRAARRPATLTCSTRALPRLKPAQPGCWKGRAAPYHCALRVQVPHGGEL